MPQGLTKTTKENIAKILFIIKQAPSIHLRGIARALNMKPLTVSSVIDRYLLTFLDVNTENYGARLKRFSIKEDKENTALEDVLRVYQVKKSIRNR